MGKTPGGEGGWLRRIGPAAILFLVSTLSAGDDPPSRNVLLLHAYHSGYLWTDEVTEAALGVLQADPSVKVHIEYMDTKRRREASYLEEFRNFLAVKYRDQSFDVLLASDDNALVFLDRYRDELFPDVPIVFCGVSDYDPTLRERHPDVTGVLETLSVAENVEMIRDLHPDLERLVVICDGTPTGMAYRKQFEAGLTSMRFDKSVVYFGGDLTMQDLLTRLRNLPDRSVVLLGIWLRDAAGVYWPPDEGVRLIARNANAPVYSLTYLGLGQGVVGGKITSPFFHGREAGRRVRRILDGTQAERIPVTTDTADAFTFDYPALKRWKIDPARLPSWSRILNRPYSTNLYQSAEFWGGLAFIALQSLVIGFLIYTIVERRRIEQELRRSRNDLLTTIRSIGDGVIVTDARGRVAQMNPVAESFVGLSEEEARGRPVETIYTLRDEATGDRLENPIDQVLRGERIEPVSHHSLLVGRHGGERPVSDSLSPIVGENKRVQGVVIVFRDETEKHRAAKALREAHDDLERKVEERTAELQEAYERLQDEMDERARVQEQLIHSERHAVLGTLAGGVAHEFNNINNSILGFSQLLLEKPDLPEMSRDGLERIHAAARRAGGITENLLTFSRVRPAGAEPRDVEAVLDETLSLIQHEFESDGIEFVFHYGHPPSARMDPGQIGQVLLNLLVNARHALLERPERRITIDTGAEEGRVFIRVRDTGCGIAEENLALVFRPFFSTKGEFAGDSPQSSVKGTGLGLSVCQTIVENHGGEITVESRLDRGSVFTVWLPSCDETETPRASETTEEKVMSSVSARILVIEDEPDTRHLLRLLLEKEGHAVETTDDGAGALGSIGESPPDLILLDLQMPRMDGTQFLERLRAMPLHPQPGVVVVTGLQIENMEEARSPFGLFSVLRKPFELHDIRRVVREALEARGEGG